MAEATEVKKELHMPNKSIVIKIGQGSIVNDYEIKMPSNGQRIDIETRKLQLTRGMHKDLVMGSASSVDAYVLVEMIATFNVLIPQLAKDINFNSLLELDALQTRSFLKAYEDYYKWDSEWREFLNQSFEEEKK